MNDAVLEGYVAEVIAATIHAASVDDIGSIPGAIRRMTSAAKSTIEAIARRSFVSELDQARVKRELRAMRIEYDKLLAKARARGFAV